VLERRTEIVKTLARGESVLVAGVDHAAGLREVERIRELASDLGIAITGELTAAPDPEDLVGLRRNEPAPWWQR
jgi:hypothetical protein